MKRNKHNHFPRKPSKKRVCGISLEMREIEFKRKIYLKILSLYQYIVGADRYFYVLLSRTIQCKNETADNFVLLQYCST